MFRFDDQIQFTKAVYYNFNPIRLPRTFKDATGGFGNFAPLQGWIQVYDSEGYCGQTFCTRAMVDTILPMILTGETKTYNEWYESLYWRIRNFGFQSGAAVELGHLDLVMLDLLANRAEKPLHRFLGATKDYAEVYKGGGSILLEDSELVEDMQRYVSEGYTTVKFKIGSDLGKNLERDLRRVELVRGAIGNDINLAVDGNQVWDAETAYQVAKLIEPYNIAWFEEPVHSHDMNEIKRLKDMGLPMKMAFGESIRNYYPFETYIEKGVEHLQPLIGRMSRMSDLLKISKLAKDNDLDFSSGGTTHLNAVFGALYPEGQMIEYHEPIVYTLAKYLEVKPEERDGRFYLPNIPGSPIRIALDKLEKEGALESKQYFYSESANFRFSVNNAY